MCCEEQKHRLVLQGWLRHFQYFCWGLSSFCIKQCFLTRFSTHTLQMPKSTNKHLKLPQPFPAIVVLNVFPRVTDKHIRDQHQERLTFVVNLSILWASVTSGGQGWDTSSVGESLSRKASVFKSRHTPHLWKERVSSRDCRLVWSEKSLQEAMCLVRRARYGSN